MNRPGKSWAVPMTGAGVTFPGAVLGYFLSPKGFLRVELRDIETFLVVAEELHFRRAAERLCISAGRVSQTVRALEQEVGAPLFGRTTRRVRLTALGEQLRDDTREAIEQLRRAVHVARASARDENGALRMGYPSCVAAPLVAKLLSAFEARHPGTSVVSTTLSEPVGFTALRQREVDVVLAYSPDGNTAAVTDQECVAGPVLATDPRVALVAADHPLARRPWVSMEQLADYRVLDLPGVPPAYRYAWTPQRTLSGTPLRRAPNHPSTSDVAGAGEHPAALSDVLRAVRDDHLVHLSVRSLLTHRSFPGLVGVAVSGLPPCVLAPVWQPESETLALRAFVEFAHELSGSRHR